MITDLERKLLQLCKKPIRPVDLKDQLKRKDRYPYVLCRNLTAKGLLEQTVRSDPKMPIGSYYIITKAGSKELSK